MVAALTLAPMATEANDLATEAAQRLRGGDNSCLEANSSYPECGRGTIPAKTVRVTTDAHGSTAGPYNIQSASDHPKPASTSVTGNRLGTYPGCLRP